MATHSSILAWEIPWTEEPGGLQSQGHKESDTTEQLTHTRDFNRHFSQGNIQMDNKHMKRCSLVIKDIQIKTTMRYQMILTRTVIFFKKWTVTSVDEDVEKLVTLHVLVGK